MELPSGPMPAPLRIGRFTVLRTLGKGGMGVVYSAFDEELDRRVAIKLMRPQVEQGSMGRARMVREAQAMARLSHPNVVQIYEVGELDDQVFMAMELVEGQTLREWCKQSPRSWREILTVMRGAGAGLRAAHERGLVHRDFKPDNVIVGHDGRVRVLDFGIACVEFEVDTQDEPVSASGSGGRWSEVLTRQGAIVGTPAYMSAEQHLGQKVDARSDQFSFCVTLYECLYGRRPFTGGAQPELAANVVAGKPLAPPRGSHVPAWLWRTTLRGLHVDSAQRWPSMAALLEQLGRDPGRTRRRFGAAVAMAAMVGLSGYSLARAGTTTDSPCTGAAERMSAVWNDERAQAMQSSFEATELVYAEDSWTRARAHLDAYAEQWVQMRTDACEATQVRHEQSDELLDLRMSCLDGRLGGMSALIDVLSEADEDIVRRAPRATAELDPLARCADVTTLMAQLPPPEDQALAEYVERARGQLTQAGAHRRAGQYDRALTIAQDIADDERTARYRPLQAEAYYRVGELMTDRGSFKEAEPRLLDAYFIAEAIGHDEMLLDSATSLTNLVGNELARYEEGLVWSRHAEAVGERLGRDDAAVGSVTYHRGLVLERMGRFEEARELYTRVIDARRQHYGSNHPQVGAALGGLANIHSRLGDYDKAITLLLESVRVYEDGLGPHHPHVVSVYNNLGIAYKHKGDYDQAAAALEHSIELSEQALGKEHATTAAGYINVGLVYRRQGDPDRAEASFRHGEALAEAALGADHPFVQAAVANIADLLERQGRHEEALVAHERALALAEQRFGDDHYRVGTVLSNQADTLTSLGRLDEAQAGYERALLLAEQTHGEGHRGVLSPLLGLANIAIARGDAASAVPGTERALQVAESTGVPDEELARVRLRTAEVLWAANLDRTRAHELARAAREGYVRAGEGYAQQQAAIDAWLEAHPRP